MSSYTKKVFLLKIVLIAVFTLILLNVFLPSINLEGNMSLEEIKDELRSYVKQEDSNDVIEILNDALIKLDTTTTYQEQIEIFNNTLLKIDAQRTKESYIGLINELNLNYITNDQYGQNEKQQIEAIIQNAKNLIWALDIDTIESAQSIYNDTIVELDFVGYQYIQTKEGKVPFSNNQIIVDYSKDYQYAKNGLYGLITSEYSLPKDTFLSIDWYEITSNYQELFSSLKKNHAFILDKEIMMLTNIFLKTDNEIYISDGIMTVKILLPVKSRNFTNMMAYYYYDESTSLQALKTEQKGEYIFLSLGVDYFINQIESNGIIVIFADSYIDNLFFVNASIVLLLILNLLILATIYLYKIRKKKMQSYYRIMNKQKIHLICLEIIPIILFGYQRIVGDIYLIILFFSEIVIILGLIGYDIWLLFNINRFSTRSAYKKYTQNKKCFLSEQKNHKEIEDEELYDEEG